MNHVTSSLLLTVALLALAGPARARDNIAPHLSLALAAGVEGRRVTGDTVDASSLGATARAHASLSQTQDDGAIFHVSGFGEIGGIGGDKAGAAGVDLGVGVKAPFKGAYAGFFRLGTRAEYAGDRAATVGAFTFPRLELGFVASTKRVYAEATLHGGLGAGSFSPAIATLPASSPVLPDFATTTHRPLGPGIWGAAVRVHTPYAFLDARWARSEPSQRAAGHVDAIEARACAGYWLVICGHGGTVRGPVLVPFHGWHDAQLVTFGISVGIGRELDATTGVF